MRTLLPEKYPNLKVVDIRPSDDDRKKAFDETQTLLRVHPNVKVIMAIASPAVPGAAEAVKQSGRKDVGVTGLGLPNASKPYLIDGVLDSAVLWNTKDLGYLTVHVATALAKGTHGRRHDAVPGRPPRPARGPRRQRHPRHAVHVHQGERRRLRFLRPDPALHEGTESMSVQPLPRWDDAATAGMSEARAPPLPVEPARLRPPHHQLRRRQHLRQDPPCPIR